MKDVLVTNHKATIYLLNYYRMQFNNERPKEKKPLRQHRLHPYRRVVQTAKNRKTIGNTFRPYCDAIKKMWNRNITVTSYCLFHICTCRLHQQSLVLGACSQWNWITFAANLLWLTTFYGICWLENPDTISWVTAIKWHNTSIRLSHAVLLE